MIVALCLTARFGNRHVDEWIQADNASIAGTSDAAAKVSIGAGPGAAPGESRR